MGVPVIAVGFAGPISASNSLLGSTTDDRVGEMMQAFEGGYFGAISNSWDDFGVTNAGAATLAKGDLPLAGTINEINSVIGINSGPPLTMGFDSFREQFVIGRPADNMISIRQISLFESGFD